jgi:membrane associated rhomboid family serine protease
VYLGAGLALLGFLGSGKRADLAGHGFGFLCGVAAGALSARLHRPRRVTLDAVLAALVPLAVVLAWWRALR